MRLAIIPLSNYIVDKSVTRFRIMYLGHWLVFMGHLIIICPLNRLLTPDANFPLSSRNGYVEHATDHAA